VCVFTCIFLHDVITQPGLSDTRRADRAVHWVRVRLDRLSGPHQSTCESSLRPSGREDLQRETRTPVGPLRERRWSSFLQEEVSMEETLRRVRLPLLVREGTNHNTLYVPLPRKTQSETNQVKINRGGSTDVM